jgi:hypothetical protein
MPKKIQFSRTSFALVAVTLIISACNLNALDRPKPKLLPNATETRWINAVKRNKTKDGATVAEVLTYAEKMRPKQFKVGEIGVGYNGATGEPDGVYIGYWLGAKRLETDSYVDLGYEMTPEGQVKPVRKDDAMTSALEQGRTQFLHMVDEAYKLNCHPGPDEKPDC